MKRSPELNPKIMSAIRGKETGIEVRLRKALYAKGLRYRKNSKYIFGHPDVSMKGLKVAIFCDSEFWHGKNFAENEAKLTTNREYWVKKIKRNIERDQEVNARLRGEGYTVLRFWGEEIEKHLDDCVDKIVAAVEQNKTRLLEEKAGEQD